MSKGNHKFTQSQAKRNDAKTIILKTYLFPVAVIVWINNGLIGYMHTYSRMYVLAPIRANNY